MFRRRVATSCPLSSPYLHPPFPRRHSASIQEGSRAIITHRSYSWTPRHTSATWRPSLLHRTLPGECPIAPRSISNRITRTGLPRVGGWWLCRVLDYYQGPRRTRSHGCVAEGTLSCVRGPRPSTVNISAKYPRRSLSACLPATSNSRIYNQCSSAAATTTSRCTSDSIQSSASSFAVNASWGSSISESGGEDDRLCWIRLCGNGDELVRRLGVEGEGAGKGAPCQRTIRQVAKTYAGDSDYRSQSAQSNTSATTSANCSFSFIY